MSTTDTTGKNPQTAKGNGVPWLALFVVAALVTVVYVSLSVAAWVRADDSDLTADAWTRLTFVLHGVEAIAFTAIGWLFGREVHRSEAESAKKDKEQAQETATSAQATTEQVREEKTAALLRGQDAESRGRELAEGIRVANLARAQAGPSGAGAPTGRDAEGGDELSPADDGTRSLPPAGSTSAGPAVDAVPDHLVALADRLFPPR
ncbi:MULTISPECIES: hypothetical protein [unclassified Terrabacter]|uniref:hypothetical protein n=1 Tax=unclassified Terrabacter TaxID=2630222 RepID=UPI0006FDFDE2|nr:MULTISPECIES: hypothetical protein [unclassified Terrabacter]KRB43849.1 hypothetical protein ASD90_19730 [Terrabacter sp. Root181]KRF46794.1 hypothetical protein ASG96_01830 [Terrabacter sp. Soil810]